jgi:hypothetical protein
MFNQLRNDLKTALYFYWLLVERFKNDRKAKVGIAQILVDVTLISVFLPIALIYIAATNTDDWDPTMETFYKTIFPLLIVVGVVLAVVLPLVSKANKI